MKIIAVTITQEWNYFKEIFREIVIKILLSQSNGSTRTDVGGHLRAFILAMQSLPARHVKIFSYKAL